MAFAAFKREEGDTEQEHRKKTNRKTNVSRQTWLARPLHAHTKHTRATLWFRPRPTDSSESFAFCHRRTNCVVWCHILRWTKCVTFRKRCYKYPVSDSCTLFLSNQWQNVPCCAWARSKQNTIFFAESITDFDCNSCQFCSGCNQHAGRGGGGFFSEISPILDLLLLRKCYDNGTRPMSCAIHSAN